MKGSNRGRGRPKSSEARTHEAKTYFNEQELVELENLSSITGDSKAKILREAFNMYNNYRKYQLSEDN